MISNRSYQLLSDHCVLWGRLFLASGCGVRCVSAAIHNVYGRTLDNLSAWQHTLNQAWPSVV